MAQSPRRRPPSGVVAFLLTDIQGSTRLWQEHGAAMPAAIDRHDQLLRAGIEANHGTVLTERGEGDSFFAVFPRASDAIAAARDIQRALHAEAWPDGIEIRVRMAINTGEAGGDYRGMAANRSARIRQLARGGQVLISQTTHGLVADAAIEGVTFSPLGTRQLKDVDRPEHAFEVHIAGVPGIRPEPPVRRGPGRALLLAAALVVAIVIATGAYALHLRGGGPGHAHAQAPPRALTAGSSRLLIATVAGDGAPGYASGLTRATDARLDHPEGLAIDGAGDVYIADTGNNMIRELLPDGTLQDVVGGGGELPAVGEQAVDVKLDHPTGLFFAAGELYIADTGNHRLIRFDVASGHVFLVAGNGHAGSSGTPGPATNAELSAPTGVAHGLLSSQPNAFNVAETGLILADSGGAIVRQVEDFDGSINPTLPGLSLQPGGLPSVAVSPAGIFYISDSSRAVVYRLNPGLGPASNSSLVPIVVGTGTAGYSGDGKSAYAAQLSDPEGLALNANGDLYICDAGNSVVRVVDADTGRIATLAGTGGVVGFSGDGGAPESAQLANPAAVAVAPDGSVYIADTGNNRIRRITARSGG